MVYSNADITKAEQAAEIIAFADYWQQATGSDPGPAGLRLPADHLQDPRRAVRPRHQMAHPAPARQDRARPPGRPARLAHGRPPSSPAPAATGGPACTKTWSSSQTSAAKVRQIAVKNIGRDEPTLLITNDLTTPGKNLFARYAERMMVENELDAYIGGFHLDALTSGVPLNVDLDTTLTVVAGNLYRLLALKLSRYEHATPETLWRDFLDATGTLHIDRHRRHLRAEPAQPPPRPHRRRIRRTRNPDPLVGRPHPAVPVPATMITAPQGTSTQLSDRESRLTGPRSADRRPAPSA